MVKRAADNFQSALAAGKIQDIAWDDNAVSLVVAAKVGFKSFDDLMIRYSSHNLFISRPIEMLLFNVYGLSFNEIAFVTDQCRMLPSKNVSMF